MKKTMKDDIQADINQLSESSSLVQPPGLLVRKLERTLYLFMILILPVALYAQQDVTQFLDIPVDGYKPVMIQKLTSKGFTINRYNEDTMDGEFNGTDVNIFIGTNKNKVWRIGVYNVNPTDEVNIKIMYNKLIRQFANNNRYLTQPDSAIEKYMIPEAENISYEIEVNKKRYEVAFFQKSIKYDSVFNELTKSALYEDNNRFKDVYAELSRETMNSLNKQVWFRIIEDNGKYHIAIYYDNENNKADGSDL